MYNNTTIVGSLLSGDETDQEKAIIAWQFVKDYTASYGLLEGAEWHSDDRWVSVSDKTNPVHFINTQFGMCGDINGTLAALLELM
jgi:hypothetical protein